MDIAIERKEELAVVGLKGRLDTMTAPDFDQAVNALLDDEVRRILVDFSAVEYMSSAGLRSLLMLAKKLGGGGLVLCGLNDLVAEVFSVSGFAKLFTMCADRDQGLEKLS